MYIFFSVMVIICAILLTLIVLIQNSKGGGLASNFGQGNQVMGVKKTTDFLEKATWTLAVGLMVFCMLASFTIPNKRVKEPVRVEEVIPNANPDQQSQTTTE
ncbi:MAG: preprotein translocase subunit SecG [Bacteroidales bacterium]|jgi:preprotein translocase subunit SecG|nr:preprotein translocase subunit SecG [Bacteroidales bacterium]